MRAVVRDLYLQIFGSIKRPVKGVHIINSHYVTTGAPSNSDSKVFRAFLTYLSGFAEFITLPEAIARIEEGEANKSIAIAFTWDDGYLECFNTIAPILEEFETRGAFFINANYVESSQDYQKEYHDRVLVYTKSPMNWNQINELHQRGHLIGSHTLDHYNLATCNATQQEAQLVKNKAILEQKLDYSCDHFAWPFGGFQHFPEAALNIALKHHDFIYSGTDFKNYTSYKGRVYNRRHLEPFWKKSHIAYFLSHAKL